MSTAEKWEENHSRLNHVHVAAKQEKTDELWPVSLLKESQEKDETERSRCTHEEEKKNG